MVNEEESKVKKEVKKSIDAGSYVEVGGDTLGDKDDVKASTRKSEYLYKADQLYLRRLLPEETWRKILGMLRGSPEDLQNCVNASPYFWELLRDQRVVFLFPEVFDILVDLYEPRGWFEVSELEVQQPERKVADLQRQRKVEGKNEANHAGNEEDDKQKIEETAEEEGQAEDFEDNFDIQDDMDGRQEDLDSWKPVRLPAGTKANDEKWKKAVQMCRLVSPSWNKAIEEFYARPEMNNIEGFRDDPNPQSPVNLRDHTWTGIYIDCTRSAGEFIQHFEASHHSGTEAPPKNPVLGRYMSLVIDMGSNVNQNRETTTQILEMFGNELWYIQFILSSWRLPHDQLYLKFREWLRLVPNLKYLQLCGIKCPGKVSKSLITSHPMPKLENLQMIDIDDGSGGPVINEVLRRNCHVVNLKLSDMLKFDKKIGGSLSNLSFYSTHNMDSHSDKMMKKYGAGWKLTKADVYKGHGDFKGLFKLVQNNWAETLTDLRLVFPHDEKTNILKPSKNLRLNLPHLRRLRLNVGGYMLLDFILPLANTLEYLEIWTWDSFEERDGNEQVAQEQVIQFAGFENKMHQSNIWQIFKKLITIKIESVCDWGWGVFAVYTREGDKLLYLHKGVYSDRYDLLYR